MPFLALFRRHRVWIAPGHGGEWYGGKIAAEGGSISLQAWHELLDALPFPAPAGRTCGLFSTWLSGLEFTKGWQFVGLINYPFAYRKVMDRNLYP
jgi:hypothetical protein